MSQGVDPRLASALHELFGLAADDLALRADLAEDLFLDSLAVLELCVWLEDVTGAEVGPGAGGEAAPRTLGDLQALLPAEPGADTVAPMAGAGGHERGDGAMTVEPEDLTR